jgi:cell division protein FtsZ
MSEPLKPAYVAPPEARREAAPVAQRPAPAPYAAPVEEASDGPGLFDDMPASAFQPEMDVEEVVADDMPPPAYRPQPVAQAPLQTRQAAPSHDADPGAFVAPRPRTPGSPSPEAMARLQAAVSKNPGMAARPAAPAAAPRAAAPAPAKAAQEPRPRFGIGGLISRMAGGHAEAERPAVSARHQPPVTSYDDEQEPSADQERIEIPAFLRRQAN